VPFPPVFGGKSPACPYAGAEQMTANSGNTDVNRQRRFM
jgi:hypothetical protein